MNPMPLRPNRDVSKHISIVALWALFTILLFSLSCKRIMNGDTNHAAHADSIIDQTNDLLIDGQTARSLKFLDSAYAAFKNPGPIDLWKKYDKKNNFYLDFVPDSAKARIYADSMLLVLKGREQANSAEYGNTIFAQGDVLMARRKFDEAFKYYYDGRQYIQSNLDTCSLCDFSYRLGQVRYNQAQYLKAVPYLKQAIAENSHCKSAAGFRRLFTFPQRALNTIALCYEKSDMPDSAIIYYRLAVSFINRNAKKFPDKRKYAEVAKGVVYGNLGGVYAKQNKFADAEKYLKLSILINDHPGYEPGDAQTAAVKLAGLYINFSHFREADSLLRKLEIEFVPKPGTAKVDDRVLLFWCRLRWSYFDKTHLLPQAYQYVQKYHNLKDSLEEISKGLRYADLDKGFKGTEQQYKIALLKKDNELKTAYLVGAIIFSLMAISILVGVWHNLVRTKQNVAELTRLNGEINDNNSYIRKAMDALEQSQEDNSRMMKIVAHDLRNPIGAITSTALMMLDDKDRTEDDKMMLGFIKTSGENSLDLVDGLLQVHPPDEELIKEPVDLLQMLGYCVELMHFKADAKQQKIELQAKSVTAPVNREKMWRVLSNIIANAIKFSPLGADILVTMEEKPDSVLIAVEDHGIGIPDELKDKIFDMFTEARRDGTAGEQPFGLGLAISKQIVEAHGGKIWFNNKPGDGTTFFCGIAVGRVVLYQSDLSF